jgi:hypothetical protein
MTASATPSTTSPTPSAMPDGNHELTLATSAITPIAATTIGPLSRSVGGACAACLDGSATALKQAFFATVGQRGGGGQEPSNQKARTQCRHGTPATDKNIESIMPKLRNDQNWTDDLN